MIEGSNKYKSYTNSSLKSFSSHMMLLGNKTRFVCQSNRDGGIFFQVDGGGPGGLTSDLKWGD